MKFVFTISFIILFAFGSFAQAGYSVNGRVKDDKGKNVDECAVGLFKAADSSLVKYGVVEKGIFVFNDIRTGSYFLKISCTDFEEKFQALNVTGNTGIEILLTDKVKDLEEVQVTGAKKMFSYKGGNIKVNVENSVLNSITDPIELLSKLPAVQVSSDRGSVTIVGKGEPLIYLENQRITMNDLASLSVNDIKNIEIINNPSSKYEAEGRAVILVTGKSNNKEGAKLDVTESASMKRGFQNRTAVNGSFKKNKVEVKANLQYAYQERYEGIGSNMTFNGNSASNFFGESKGPRSQYLAGIGLYKQLNETDYFSLNINGRLQDEPYTIVTDSYLKQDATETNVHTSTTNNSHRPYVNSILNYSKALKKINSEVFVGGQYSHYQRNVVNHISNNFNNTQLVPSEDRKQAYSVDVGVGRVDFEKNFSNRMKWESGVSFTTAHAVSVFEVKTFSPEISTNTNYDYTENNQAIYTQLSGKLRKLEYSGGLRIENTVLQGGYKDSANLLLDKQFSQLFPKVNIEIPIDSSMAITLNYTKSINRPDYSSANQITNYVNPFYEYSNNINLLPSISNEVSANFQYKDYSVRLAAYQTRNPTYFITEYNQVDNKVRMINRNLDMERGVNVTITVPVQYKILTSTNMLTADLNKVTYSSAVINKTIPYIYFYSNNQFKLPKGYNFTLSGWVTTTQYRGIFQHNGQFNVDLSLSRVFYKKLTCTINAFDIFRSLNSIDKFNANGINSSTTFYENVREIGFTVRYTIGKLKDMRYKSKDVNDNGNRLN